MRFSLPNFLSPTHTFICRGLILSGFFVCVLFARDAFAQMEKIVATYGEWFVSCGVPPGGKNEVCGVVQPVTAADRPGVGLTVLILKSPKGDRKVLRVVAPQGVLLPPGIDLHVDGKQIGSLPYMQCGKIGCMAQSDIKPDLEDMLKNGKQAVFVIHRFEEFGIGLPIELKGLTKALAKLK